MPIKHTCIVGNNQKTEELMLSMGRAVRLHCLECVGFSSQEVKDCSHTICAMWPFRFGKDPGRVTRQLTEEERAVASERFRMMREDKLRAESYVDDNYNSYFDED